MWVVPDYAGLGVMRVCTCDYCLRPITASDPGGPVIPRVIELGKTYVVQHAHDGRCRDCLEERLAKECEDPPRSEKDNGD
jgi:hypothetical protein